MKYGAETDDCKDARSEFQAVTPKVKNYEVWAFGTKKRGGCPFPFGFKRQKEVCFLRLRAVCGFGRTVAETEVIFDHFKRSGKGDVRSKATKVLFVSFYTVSAKFAAAADERSLAYIGGGAQEVFSVHFEKPVCRLPNRRGWFWRNSRCRRALSMEGRSDGHESPNRRKGE